MIEAFKYGLNNNCMSATDARANEFFDTLKNLLRQNYTKPLSPRLYARAKHDHRMIRSIRRIRKKQNLIIQRTDKSKVFHVGTAASYHTKSIAYMAKTNAYKQIENNSNPCMQHFRRVITFLDPLLKKKAIDLTIWKRWMRPDVNIVELAHLYFLPKPHKIGTPLRPIVSSMRASATGISHFLDQLLRPLFNQVARRTTAINGIHFVRQLEFYRNCNRLLSSTKFVTFDVTDLYTMIPRDGALLILNEFLRQYATNGRINGMTIDTLMKMARMVLDTNCFIFENQYYQQIRGGAMGSPFTMTLANIYMLKWEEQLIEHQQLHKELYLRYIDDVFMTTNLPLNQIYTLLDQANNKDPNISITLSVAARLDYLDVNVNNKQGQLQTTVFHKSAAEPYVVPFRSDHPRHVHRNIIRGALYRAVRVCSNVNDFNVERLNIEMTLLLNGYPPKYIAYHFKQFFTQNNAISLLTELDNDLYMKLHHELIHQITGREKKEHQQQQQLALNKREIRIPITFENGPLLYFKRDIKRLWKQFYVYQSSPMNNVTLKIETRTNKSLIQLLSPTKPPRSMLR